MRGQEYRLRGRHASRRSFIVPDELMAQHTEPSDTPQPPRWYSIVAFLILSSATVFAMCAMGRPGA